MVLSVSFINDGGRRLSFFSFELGSIFVPTCSAGKTLLLPHFKHFLLVLLKVNPPHTDRISCYRNIKCIGITKLQTNLRQRYKLLLSYNSKTPGYPFFIPCPIHPPSNTTSGEAKGTRVLYEGQYRGPILLLWIQKP